ncbi:MAG: YggS family pyridoxal phosphate-dependent enzyme [Candidatus Cyclobacteriaceae bacterium M2_1C_046]
MSVKNKIIKTQESLNKFNAKLIAVTKTHPVSLVKEAYEAGHRDFGENKVQELLDKQPELPNDINWHLIGHLQRNKVKFVVPFIHLIHSVDSEKLLKEINKQAKKIDRPINCLLQVHIAQEESKFGLSEENLKLLLNSDTLRDASHVQVKGLMGMATFTDNDEQVRKEFQHLKNIFDELKKTSLPENVHMDELSMGMSSDYKVALEEGSTMVRVGSAIFGERNYS